MKVQLTRGPRRFGLPTLGDIAVLDALMTVRPLFLHGGTAFGGLAEG
jgi:hypothetical protein